MVPCRSCGGRDLNLILSLGAMPLANSLLTDEEARRPEFTCPLDLVYCPACGLVQISEIVPPEKMFSDYVYFSSYSDTLLAHAKELVELLLARRPLDAKSLVIEIASNDGYLLQYFIEKNVPVLGIDPAENIAKEAWEKRRVPTLCEFFGADLAARLVSEGRQADLVIGNNVLAHVPDLNGFLEGVRLVLKPAGMAVFEVPYLMDLIARCEFDTIYHEHQCYFSLTALARAFSRHSLQIVDVEHVPIHGGTLRIYAATDPTREVSGTVRRMLSEESAVLNSPMPALFQSFSGRVRDIKASLRQFILERRSAGRRVAAYGAAAKGCVLMNYCELGQDLVEFVVDRNPVKQGKRMPGTRQPIFAPEALMERKPDFVLILPWNIADEIVRQQIAYRSAGGKFIVPVPEIREVG